MDLDSAGLRLELTVEASRDVGHEIHWGLIPVGVNGDRTIDGWSYRKVQRVSVKVDIFGGCLPPGVGGSRSRILDQQESMMEERGELADQVLGVRMQDRLD